MEKVWEQPKLYGGGFVHIDATYWGHNWGVMVAVDESSSKVLYLAFNACTRRDKGVFFSVEHATNSTNKVAQLHIM